MLGVLVVCAAGTREWWIPPGLRDAWNQQWVKADLNSQDPREMLLAEHLNTLNAIEARYSELIEREKKKQDLLLAELERLRKEREKP